MDRQKAAALIDKIFEGVFVGIVVLTSACATVQVVLYLQRIGIIPLILR